MARYTVSKCCSSESIEWQEIPALDIDKWITRPQLPVQATAQLCWSEAGIHVRMTAKEPQILARFTGDFDMVCKDSCLETFLCPIEEDGRYFNFEFNPNGASYFGFGYGRNDRIRLHPANIRELLSINPKRNDNDWEVRFDIPLMLIRLFFPEFVLDTGKRLRANFYKCGDDIRPEHELMWNRITNGKLDFHQSEFFDVIELG